MSAERSGILALLIFLLFFLLFVGFVFDLLPSREDVARYYAALVSFDWLPSTAYVEGQYEGVLGTANSWVEEGRRGFTALLNSEYGEYVRRFLMCYPVFAVVILLFPWYPKTFNQLFGHLTKDDVVPFLFVCVVGGLLFSAWLAYIHIADNRHHWPFQNDRILNSIVGLLLLLPGLAGLLVALVFVVSGIIWVPLGLFFLPGFVCALVLAIGKGLFLFVSSPVKLLFITWHYLHYLFVPHPAEGVFLKHQKIKMERGVKIDHAALGEELSTVMYNKEREGLPAWWKSESRRKRLEKLRGRIKVEKDIVDDETEDSREKNKRRR